MKIYKCDICGFECVSVKVMATHMDRERLGLTPYQFKKYAKLLRECETEEEALEKCKIVR